MDILERALDQLALYGILLKSDPRLPGVTTLAAGEPVRGSWWGHPMGHQIFQTLEALADRQDATLVKLISGKDTFVHQRLFGHLISIGSAREGWQMDGLSDAAYQILKLVDKEGLVRTEGLRLPALTASRGVGEATRELEKVLLVRADSVHTSSGKHAKCLESWGRWSGRIGAREILDSNDARKEFERIMESLNGQFQARAALPWAGKPKPRG